MSKYTGQFPNIKTHYTHADVIADMNAWARKIAADNRYHYNMWEQGNTQSHKCPICSKLVYTKDPDHFGWNCIGFGGAVWHHGGEVGNICNCHWITGPGGTGDKLLSVATDEEALKLAKKYTGITDIKLIRNKNGIAKSKWQAGDICLKFGGSVFEHVFYYPGGNTVIDSTRIYNDKKKWTPAVIAKQIAERSYSNYSAKIIIRYTGNGTKYRNYIKMGDSGSEVKKLQQFLNWAMNAGLAVDGSFGDKTDTAVRAFQLKCGLIADGLFGQNSLDKAKTFDKASTTQQTTTSNKIKLKGIDISAWQDKITVENFNKAKAYGVKYVLLRIGYTGSASKKPTIDSTFENNYKNAIKAGLPVGVYYYSLATSTAMAKAEADFCIKNLKGKTISYPVYIDMEDGTYQAKCSKVTLASVCNTFCNTIKSAGYLAGVYANLNWFNNKIGNITAEHTKWVAQYNKTCDYKGTYDMWQYTSSESVPGIAKKTDVSWCYKDFTKVNKPTVVVKPKKSIDEIAQEVIDGKRGNGDARKKALTEAGYDYNAVQVKVNEMLKPKATTYSGTLPTLTLKKTNAEVIADAIKWAVWIAGDNNFHYGYTSKDKKINAHHNGCYFCGTNTDKGGRSKKGIVDYQHTYCCNPFVHAAWAHGGCVPKALEICRKGSSWDFNKGHGYDASSLFTKLGHPAKSKLKAGDVLCRDTHVALYIGNGKIAEASHGDDNKRGSKKWNDSIHITNLSDANYAKFPRVYRFNSSVNTTAILRHGEVSERVKQWQMFLNWYFDGKVGTPDGYYGDNTLKWTKQFQNETMGQGQGDGLIGEKTLAKAKSIKK